MKIQGWKYYNHAAMPSCAPHEQPDLKPIITGSIWRIDGRPVLVRWTTNWDCGYETNWWYVICDAPFQLEALSRSSRKALENCEVKRIHPKEYAEDLWAVYQEAVTRYKNFQFTADKENFIRQLEKNEETQEYWGGFSKLTGRLIGYKMCTVHKDWVEFSVSKYSADSLKLRVSDALNAVTLEHYLNDRQMKYILNGSRSVVHETNVQDYYQEHFNFRKAYCRLHIQYRAWLKPVIQLLYPFREKLRIKAGFIC